jgi:hypothetical protein
MHAGQGCVDITRFGRGKGKRDATVSMHRHSPPIRVHTLHPERPIRPVGEGGKRAMGAGGEGNRRTRCTGYAHPPGLPAAGADWPPRPQCGPEASNSTQSCVHASYKTPCPHTLHAASRQGDASPWPPPALTRGPVLTHTLPWQAPALCRTVQHTATFCLDDGCWGMVQRLIIFCGSTCENKTHGGRDKHTQQGYRIQHG